MWDRSEIHVDRVLTDYVLGIADELSNVADALFPPVKNIKRESDTYRSYDVSSWRRLPEALRAKGTAAAISGITYTTATYLALERALRDSISIRDVNDADEVLDLERDTAAQLAMKIKLLREQRVATLAQTITNYPSTPDHRLTAAASPWTTSTNDPRTLPSVNSINHALTLVRRAQGARANLIVITEHQLNTLRSNDLVRDAVKYVMQTTAGKMTPALLAEFFGVEKIVVADQVVESGAEGATSSMADVWTNTDTAIIARAVPSPTRNTRTFGSSFMPRPARTKRWDDPAIDGQWVEVSEISDEVIVDNTAGVILEGTGT